MTSFLHWIIRVRQFINITDPQQLSEFIVHLNLYQLEDYPSNLLR